MCKEDFKPDYKLVEKVKSLPYFVALSGVSLQKIVEAEEALQVNFADDYKTLLAEFGVFSAAGHELTGICDIKRLNVVEVTLEARKYNPDVPLDFYVIEEANIDSILIWQSPSGKIHLSKPVSKITKTHDSLLAYLTSGLDEATE